MEMEWKWRREEQAYGENVVLEPLEDDCRLLQSLLDDCLRIEIGPELMKKVERIRSLAICASDLSSKGDTEAATYLENKMGDKLMNMTLEEALPITRAFGHYLNLTGIAETHHSVRTSRQADARGATFDEVFGTLIAGGMSPDELFKAACRSHTEIVLTAHPTQVNRRTLVYKHTRLAHLLQQHDRPDLTSEEKRIVIEDLVREITALWQTDELRRRKPTPLDEARGGLHIVEQSLWAAVPAYMRKLSTALMKHCGRELPMGCTPVTFASWMGGDRDGNPNVTARTTHDVALLARWMASDLFLRDVDVLRFELSMNQANDEVWKLARRIGQAQAQPEPTAPSLPTKVEPLDVIGAPMGHLRRLSISAHHEPSNGVRQAGRESIPGAKLGLRQPMGSAAAHSAVSVPSEGPYVFSTESGIPEEVGSPPSSIMWSPRADTTPGVSPTSTFGAPPSQLLPSSLESQDDIPGTGRDAFFKPRSGLTDGLTGSVGVDMAHLELDDRTMEGKVQIIKPMQHVDSKGAILSAEDRKARGMRAAEHHKTSIDALLHPRHVGATPYRIVLGDVRQKLLATRKRMEELLAGAQPNDDEEWFESTQALAAPLLACYWSLWECGGGIVAEGRLLDCLRRLHCFGLGLMPMDIRQDSSRHTDAVDAVTTFLDLGQYSSWDEEKRIAWLELELGGKRPLIPATMSMTPEVREVIDTFCTAAEIGPESLSGYVISMATNPSDVLAVELLMREAAFLVARDKGRMPSQEKMQRVVPLFETLSDLDGASAAMRRLFSVPWYRQLLRERFNNHQEIMLGYSDSGKDAGRLAAVWALYKCQETIVEVCKEFGVELTLFHGRGGSIGRGGGPTYLAIQSQPPGSVQGSLRITEQGEMVQNKFGIPQVALRQLEIFSTAVLLATVSPPMSPRKPEWRAIMDQLSATSCAAYRAVVFENPIFMDYFRAATAEDFLGDLNIGSRPARRKTGGGVETLRAIPWIFSWTQTRLVLPAWLGIGEALVEAFEQGHKAEIQAMYQEWPFFQSTVDLIEMILAKADMRIAALYDQQLVSGEAELQLGAQLRQKFAQTLEAVLQVTGNQWLCANNPSLRRLLQMRSPHIDPINILQVEILKRLRKDPSNQSLRDALLISINGVSAGMRNTG